MVVKKIIDKICNVIILAFILGVAYILLSVFVFASFKIPSGSMYPEVQAGDNILVFKPTVGARIFNLFASLDEKQVKIHRMPGFRKVKRNDVIVFNFPYPNGSDKMKMHILKYYSKRCVALPGDTLCIVDGYYKVRGTDMPLGNIEIQKEISESKVEDIPKEVFYCLYKEEDENWNVKNFGPYYIPKAGATIKMNRKNYLLYHKLIEWEQGCTTSYRNDTIFVNDKHVTEYCFKKNYYFAAGDYAKDSQDSRYWGVLPEEYIVGVAWIVWESQDPVTGKLRWNRFLKRIR